MTPPATLAEPLRRTFEKIMQPSADAPLEWREVRALFRELGEVSWQPNGDFKVELNGCILLLRPSSSKDVAAGEERLELRRFLEQPELPATGNEVPPGSAKIIDIADALPFKSARAVKR